MDPRFTCVKQTHFGVAPNFHCKKLYTLFKNWGNLCPRATNGQRRHRGWNPRRLLLQRSDRWSSAASGCSASVFAYRFAPVYSNLKKNKAGAGTPARDPYQLPLSVP